MRRPGFRLCVFRGIVMVKCVFLMSFIAGGDGPGGPLEASASCHVHEHWQRFF